MTKLPNVLLSAPRIFYGLAIFFAAFNVVLPFLELSGTGYSVTLGGAEGGITRFAIARSIERALYDSLFLVGLGVNAQLLIAIWMNTRPSVVEQEAAE